MILFSRTFIWSHSLISREKMLFNVRPSEEKEPEKRVGGSTRWFLSNAQETRDLLINWPEPHEPKHTPQISISLSEINIKFKVWKRCKEGILLKEHQEFISTVFFRSNSWFFFSISVRFARYLCDCIQIF